MKHLIIIFCIGVFAFFGSGVSHAACSLNPLAGRVRARAEWRVERRASGRGIARLAPRNWQLLGRGNN